MEDRRTGRIVDWECCGGHCQVNEMNEEDENRILLKLLLEANQDEEGV